MDSTHGLMVLDGLVRVLQTLGPAGIWLVCLAAPLAMTVPFCVLLVLSLRGNSGLLQAYRQDTQHALREFDNAVDALGNYYKDNVLLVKNYERVANDLHNVIILTTQTLQRLCDKLDGRGL